MTVGDYISGKLEFWGIDYPKQVIELEAAKIGYSAESEITADMNLDLFFYNVIPDILLLPSNVSEGGYSISFDKKAMVEYYSLISARLGKPNRLSVNTIKDITNRW